MKAKITLEDEINDFLMMWHCDKFTQFLNDIIPIFELYDVDEENDWVKDEVGESNKRNVRLIRAVYLLSRLAEFHAGALCGTNVKFKNLWKRMEEEC